jgi:NAD(P)-dependent dehydrogenase (short-subunit alcohol dehydrogenase family)
LIQRVERGATSAPNFHPTLSYRRGKLFYSECCYKLRPFVVFLASPAAAYITGQAIAVDGGATAW